MSVAIIMHTSYRANHVLHDDDMYVPTPDKYSHNGSSPRCLENKSVNAVNTRMLDLCCSMVLRIINGRMVKHQLWVNLLIPQLLLLVWLTIY